MAPSARFEIVEHFKHADVVVVDNLAVKNPRRRYLVRELVG